MCIRDRMKKGVPGGEFGKMGGLLPMKDVTPEEFDGKLEKWRQWKDDMVDYVDTVKKGLGDVLKEAEKEIATVGAGWTGAKNVEMAKGIGKAKSRICVLLSSWEVTQ